MFVRILLLPVHSLTLKGTNIVRLPQDMANTTIRWVSLPVPREEDQTCDIWNQLGTSYPQ